MIKLSKISTVAAKIFFLLSERLQRGIIAEKKMQNTTSQLVLCTGDPSHPILKDQENEWQVLFRVEKKVTVE